MLWRFKWGWMHMYDFLTTALVGSEWSAPHICRFNLVWTKWRSQNSWVPELEFGLLDSPDCSQCLYWLRCRGYGKHYIRSEMFIAWVWELLSLRILRHIVRWKSTDVSDGLVASLYRSSKWSKEQEGKLMASRIPAKWGLTFIGLHVIISQMIELCL
jgi:hypothetical protein